MNAGYEFIRLLTEGTWTCARLASGAAVISPARTVALTISEDGHERVWVMNYEWVKTRRSPIARKAKRTCTRRTRS